MRLTDLDPKWDRCGGAGISQPGPDLCVDCHGRGCSHCHNTGREYVPAPERIGIGVSFDCPCPKHQALYAAGTLGEIERWRTRVHVPFANPLDGGPPFDPPRGWQREGDTFDTLTISPSILRIEDSSDPLRCAWHGFIRNGEIIHV